LGFCRKSNVMRVIESARQRSKSIRPRPGRRYIRYEDLIDELEPGAARQDNDWVERHP
jgi:hypothetical protein